MAVAAANNHGAVIKTTRIENPDWRGAYRAEHAGDDAQLDPVAESQWRGTIDKTLGKRI